MARLLYRLERSAFNRRWVFGQRLLQPERTCQVRRSPIRRGPSLPAQATWWIPGWLDRPMPNVDIEGESLKQSPEPHLIPPGTAPSPAPAQA
jgi:hypothetical protein